MNNEEIKEALQKRHEARQQSDWKTADEIREEIEAAGFFIRDYHFMSVWYFTKRGLNYQAGYIKFDK